MSVFRRPEPVPSSPGPLSVPTLSLLSSLLAICLISSACGSSAAPPDVGPPTSVRSYLVSPVEGLPVAVSTPIRMELQRGYRALSEFGEVQVSRDVSDVLLERDPRLLPALVLGAQTDFVQGRCGAVIDTLKEPLADRPGYVAGQLLLGACSERSADPIGAYQAFRGIADTSSFAARRADALEDSAVQAVRLGLEQDIAQNRIQEAVDKLALLGEWRPGDPVTIEAQQLLAAARGDGMSELDLVRALMERGRDDRELVERRAELEVRYGEARTGVDLYRELLERYPADPSLEAALSEATFRFRMERMPPEVTRLAERALLTRGDFATLLYWTVPSLRSGSVGSGRIATDVLEHPQRDAAIRMLNLGVMDVEDPTLRNFDPDGPMRRGGALRALLVVSRLLGDPACLDGVATDLALRDDTVCETASRCMLIPGPAECLPGAPMSGSDAVEMISRTLDLTGSP